MEAKALFKIGDQDNLADSSTKTTPEGFDDQKNNVDQLPADFWSIDKETVLRPPEGLYYEMGVDMFFTARHCVDLNGHQGPIHNHSYRLRVRFRSRSLSGHDHVIVDYTTVKGRVKQVVEAYNDQFLNHLPPFRRLQPTTENLSAVMFQQIERTVGDLPTELIAVTVWESPTEAVTFAKEDLGSYRWVFTSQETEHSDKQAGDAVFGR